MKNKTRGKKSFLVVKMITTVCAP